MDKLRTPFSPKQVEALNRSQKREDRHPFTCAKHTDTALVATPEGWRCPVKGCDYAQDWAHGTMFS